MAASSAAAPSKLTQNFDRAREEYARAQEIMVERAMELERMQKELNAALKYFDKLKPSCLDAGVDFAERTARREEEIASLKDALKTLGEDA